MYVYLNHFAVYLKPTQYYKLNFNFFFFKEVEFLS